MPKHNKWNFDDPEFREMVEQMKIEIAREQGLDIPRDGYWGHTSSQSLGQIGSQLQKRVNLLLEYKRQQLRKNHAGQS